MEVGRTLCERYLLERELGRGSVGTVFAGRDLLLDREVAIKVVARRRYRCELPKWLQQAQQAARLEHPGLVSVLDFGVEHELGYLIMPLLVGRTLDELFVVGPLPLRLVAKLGFQASLAIAHAHAHGLIHANLNPRHIMLVGSNEGLQVKVLDFGVTILPEDLRRHARHQLTAGMPSYLAPELLHGDGEVDSRADIYSLGAILYEAIIGRPVLSSDLDLGREADGVDTRPLAPGTLRGDIPPEFEAMLLGLLTRQPRRRPKDAREIAELLEPYVGDMDSKGALGLTGNLGDLPRELNPEDITVDAGEARTALLHDPIGRDHALRVIDSRLAAARAKSLQLILLAGEAGIGKTTLLDELALMCQQRELELLRTRATSGDRTSWLGPFTELLTAGLAQRPEAAESLAPLANQLIGVFPDLARSRLGQLARGPRHESSWTGLQPLSDTGLSTLAPAREPSPSRRSPPNSAREHLENLLVRVFEALLASGRPLTLAVDDAHFSEEVVELLGALFRRLPRLPLVIVLAYEPAEIKTGHAINRLELRLSQHPRFLNLALPPLDAAACELLLAQLLGPETLDEGIPESLRHESGGRPLYARELVRAAVDTGSLVCRDGTWHFEVRQWPIPRQLRASLGGRLRRLPPHLLSALRIGSVLAAGSGVFSFDELLLLSGYTRSELSFMLTRAAEQALLSEVHESGQRLLHFTSQVLQRVLHEGIEANARCKLHRHCAEYLRSLPFVEDLIITRREHYLVHLLESENIKVARPLVIDRAQHALEHGAVDSAHAQLLQLLEHGDRLTTIEQGELLLLLAKLEHSRGRAHGSVAALERLIALLDAGDEPRLMRIGEQGSDLANLMDRRKLSDRLLGLRPRDRRAAERQRRARAELAALRPATSSGSMQIGDLLLMHGEYTAAREAYDSARRRAAREGDRDEEARQLQRLTRVSSNLGHYYSATNYCRAGLELLAGRHSLERVGLWALAAYAHCSAGFFERAYGELEAGKAELETHPPGRSPIRDRVAAELERSYGTLYMGTGQPQPAITAFERCLTLSSSTERWSLSVARFNLGQACAQAGHLSRALREFERASAGKRAIGDRWGFAWTQVSRVAVFRDLGEVDEGLELLAEAQEIADELNDPKLFACVHIELARHALLGGQLDQARAEARRVRDMTRTNAAPKALGEAYELLASATLADGDFDEARKFAELAAQEAEKHGDKGNKITALLLLAEVSPDSERPQLLAQARATSEQLANPYRELDVSLTSLRLGLGDPAHASDDYIALEQLSDRAERLSAQRHVGLCLLAQADVLAPHDLRGALDHARLGETQLRVLGAKLEADRAAQLITRLTLR